MEEHTTPIHSHKVTYLDDAREGVKYLRDDLSSSEAGPLFANAKAHGSSEFEDKYNRQFTLMHNPSGGYTLVRRHH